MSRATRALHWVIALLGLWELGDIAAPFVPGFGRVPAFLWNHIVTGAVLVIAGAWAALTRNPATARTLSWIATAAGAWLVPAALILGNRLISPGLWNDIGVGVIVVILSSAARLLLRPRPV